MDIIKIDEYLQSLWNKRCSKLVKGEEVVTYPTKRSTTLIVPEINWDEITGDSSLNNSDWAYSVNYCFRSALDLSYDTRYKIKTVENKETGKDEKKSIPYQVWTQGYKIGFKDGDLFHSGKGFPSIQIQKASPVEWDDKEKKVALGMVEYKLFEEATFGRIDGGKVVNQMEFLNILLFGYTNP